MFIKDAPRVEESEGHLSQSQEAELYDYYGLEYSKSASDSPSGGNPDEADRSGDPGVVGQEAVPINHEEIRLF